MLRPRGQMPRRCVGWLRQQRVHPTIADGPKHGLSATALFTTRHCEVRGLLVIKGHALPVSITREDRGDVTWPFTVSTGWGHWTSCGKPYRTRKFASVPVAEFALRIDEAHQDLADLAGTIYVDFHLGAILTLRQNRRALPTFSTYRLAWGELNPTSLTSKITASPVGEWRRGNMGRGKKDFAIRDSSANVLGPPFAVCQ